MENRQITRLYRNDEDVYHWVYNLPMFKNFSILFTVLKAMGIGMLITFAIILLILVKDGTPAADVRNLAGILALVWVIVQAVSFVCYLLVAALYGGTYVAMYVMDDKRIAQYQPADQADRERMIGTFSAAAGALGGNRGLMAGGLSIGGNLVVETPFKEIRSLKILPALNEIRVHSFLTWYTVYVNPEDFEYVAEFMESRSVNAKITRL